MTAHIDVVIDKCPACLRWLAVNAKRNRWPTHNIKRSALCIRNRCPKSGARWVEL